MRRTEIAPGVHLSWDPAQKFNRCRISIHFAFPARRETATAHALLPLLMERGYADCPDMTQMTKKLARLYGADLTVDARPLGANHNLCVSVTGIKDRFALDVRDICPFVPFFFKDDEIFVCLVSPGLCRFWYFQCLERCFICF